MTQSARLPLQGRGVLITRPAAQAASLAERLQSQGAQVWNFPTIDILPLEDDAPLRALGLRLASFDLAFFVSSNAVRQALAVLPRADWPATLRVATVGPGSAAALREAGFAYVIVPAERFDSEGVLALPEFAPQAVQGRRVLVLRGDGGRELFAETLRARGAEVEQVSCYRRRQPSGDVAPILAAWQAGQLHAISLTSSEGVDNFAALLGEPATALLAALPVFVPHERVAARARMQGAVRVICHAAGDDGMLAALVAFFAASGAERPT